MLQVVWSVFGPPVYLDTDIDKATEQAHIYTASMASIFGQDLPPLVYHGSSPFAYAASSTFHSSTYSYWSPTGFQDSYWSPIGFVRSPVGMTKSNRSPTIFESN